MCSCVARHPRASWSTLWMLCAVALIAGCSREAPPPKPAVVEVTGDIT